MCVLLCSFLVDFYNAIAAVFAVVTASVAVVAAVLVVAVVLVSIDSVLLQFVYDTFVSVALNCA